MWRWLGCAFVIVAVVATVAGCGNDEQRTIARVVTEGLTSDDPHVVCEGSLSPTLLARIYGGPRACHNVESQDSERISQALSVDVSAVRVVGRRATAVVTIHGGGHDGARGTLELAREAAGWRVSELSIGLLRSEFEASLRRHQSLDPSVRVCVIRKMRSLSDVEFRALAYGDTAASRARLTAIARHCQAVIAAANDIAV